MPHTGHRFYDTYSHSGESCSGMRSCNRYYKGATTRGTVSAPSKKNPKTPNPQNPGPPPPLRPGDELY